MAIPVQWAFIVATDDRGAPYLIEHDDAALISAKRVATLDDIYAGSYRAERYDDFYTVNPQDQTWTVAFLVFQTPHGYVAASPDVFEDVAPMGFATDWQMKAAFAVLQSQITAQRVLDMFQINVTASAKAAQTAKNKAEGKSEGGLILA